MGEIDRKQLLVESLEALLEQEDALMEGDEDLQQLFFSTRSLAEELGYSKVEAEIRNRNLEDALAILDNRPVTV